MPVQKTNSYSATPHLIGSLRLRPEMNELPSAKTALGYNNLVYPLRHWLPFARASLFVSFDRGRRASPKAHHPPASSSSSASGECGTRHRRKSSAGVTTHPPGEPTSSNGFSDFRARVGWAGDVIIPLLNRLRRSARSFNGFCDPGREPELYLLRQNPHGEGIACGA